MCACPRVCVCVHALNPFACCAVIHHFCYHCLVPGPSLSTGCLRPAPCLTGPPHSPMLRFAGLLYCALALVLACFLVIEPARPHPHQPCLLSFAPLQLLLTLGLIHHVHDDHVFKDEFLFYRWVFHTHRHTQTQRHTDTQAHTDTRRYRHRQTDRHRLYPHTLTYHDHLFALLYLGPGSMLTRTCRALPFTHSSPLLSTLGRYPCLRRFSSLPEHTLPS